MADSFEKIVFYSKSDLSAFRHLQNAEKILNSPIEHDLDINEILQLYNIKLFFDNGITLLNWEPETLQRYQSRANDFEKIVKEYFLKNRASLLGLYENLFHDYTNSYWAIVCSYALYTFIDKEDFYRLLNEKNFNVRSVLRQRKIVDYFAKELREYFKTNSNAIELILHHKEEKDIFGSKEAIYFPDIKDYDDLVSAYLNSVSINLNYVRLILNATTIKVSDKTKLLAHKRLSELEQKVFTEGKSVSQQIKVIFSKDQEEPITFHTETNEAVYSYSEKYLDGQDYYVYQVLVFIRLFGFFSYQGGINLVNKTSEVDNIEHIFVRAKDEYHLSASFAHKNLLSSMQILIYTNYLKSRGVYLESILERFVNEFFSEAYDIEGFKISFPSATLSYQDKIRVFAPELDFLIKQFKVYSEEGIVDHELLRISSSHLNFSEINSCLPNKYIYGSSQDFYRIQNYFFSSQSPLLYWKGEKANQKNFFLVLKEEDITYKDFKDFQQLELKFLEEKGYIIADEKGYLRCCKELSLFVMKVLYEEDVLSYWHYDISIRNEVDLLVAADMVRTKNSLFSSS